MKNFLIACLAVLAMHSCTGPMGPVGPVGPQGPPGTGSGEGVDWKIIDLEVPQDAWSVEGSGDDFQFYMASFSDLPEIDEFAFENGLVKCYARVDFDSDGKYDAQQELPITRHMKQDDGTNLFLWSETTDYDYGIGFLNIYFTISDFAPFVDANNYIVGPGDMAFRLVIMK